MKRLLALVLLLTGCGYGASRGYGWWDEQINRPVSAVSQPVLFQVSPGETPDRVASELQAGDLIRSAAVFRWYVRYTGAGPRIRAGEFELNRNMSMAQILAALELTRPVTIRVRLPEGSTIQQMAVAAQAAGLGSAASYEAAAGDLSWPYSFLKDRPPGAPGNLEGFLFPDTYELGPGAGSRDLVRLQLERFNQEFTPALRAAAAAPAAGRPAESSWSVLVLASIVEREVDRDPDRAIVCGVYYNRLAQGLPLGADATVQYAVGHLVLTQDDLQVSSPYNTRLHPGLPPGPVSNPGLASIVACLNPRPSVYLYYFTDGSGTTRYASTFAEFQQQQRRFGVAHS